MAVYRQIQISYWQDSFILKLTPEEKFFYLYLLTNSKTKQCGIYELPLQIIGIETGYNRETVIKLLQRFIDHRKIRYDWENEEIFLLNWIKHNPFDGNPKIKKCVEKELQTVHNPDMIPEDSPLIPLTRGIQGASQEKEKEEQKEKKVGRFTPPSLDELNSFLKENSYSIDAQQFIDFYQSKGWMVGKNKMKDWRAAVRNWLRRNSETEKAKGTPRTVDDYKKTREMLGKLDTPINEIWKPELK